MWKRLMGLFLGVCLALGTMAKMASAEGAKVKFGGDFRVRTFLLDNYDFNSDVGDTNAYLDQRFRLKTTITVNDVTKIKSRVTVVEGKWNGDGWINDGDDNILQKDDYAYLEITKLNRIFNLPVDDLKVLVGRQLANWGNKFLVWSSGRNRIKFVGKSNGYTFGGFYDKYTENFAPEGNDIDGYGLFFIGKVADTKVGVLLVHKVDEIVSETGQTLDVYWKGKVAMVDLKGELAIQPGDLNKDTADNTPMGFFIEAALKNLMPNMVVAFTFDYAANSYTASKFYTPTLFTGKCQPTAIWNFSAFSDDAAYLFAATVKYAISKAFSVYGRLAYMDMSTEYDDTEATELDAGAKYKLAKNTAFSVDAGYYIPSGDSDPAVALTTKIETKFK